MSQLETALRETAESRRALQAMQAEVATVQARLDATDDGALLTILRFELKGVKETVSQKEARAREQTVVAFALTGNKHPAEGASIRMRKRVEWRASPSAVKTWAFKNAPILLDIQAAAFDRLVEAGGLVPEAIAKVVGDPSASLARDLSSWLTEEAETDD